MKPFNSHTYRPYFTSAGTPGSSSLRYLCGYLVKSTYGACSEGARPLNVQNQPAALMMSDQPTDARTRLRNHFAGTEAIHHGKKWDELYKANFLPWDKGVPNPVSSSSRMSFNACS